jgi:hypothetical protein
MANRDIQEILKKGSKAKLIQLAIDTPEFNKEGLPNPTLTKDEIQTIKDRAKQEGWDGELFRATYKADDIEALTVYTLAEIYKAVYQLQGFNKIIEKTEILLSALDKKYIKDYNEETEKYDTVIKKKPEEIAKDIKEIERVIYPTTIPLSEIIMRTQGKVNRRQEEEKDTKETDKNKDTKGIFEIYKQRLITAKTSLYLISTSKFVGYRLYSKDRIQEIETVFFILNDYLVLDADNYLDHIDYLLDTFEEYLPEVVEEINKQEMFYIPDKKDREEILDYLRNGATFERGLGDKKYNKKEDTVLKEDYLLSDLKPKEIEEIKKRGDNLEEYVRYGK